MVETVRLISTRPEGAVRALKGQFLNERHYDPSKVIDFDADVYRPDGRLLFALRREALLTGDVRPALDGIARAARPTHRRPTAAGGEGVLFRSGVAGWLRGRPRAFNRNDPERWRAMWPLLWRLADVFAEVCPEGFDLLRSAAARSPRCVVPGTPFSTITANLDARTAAHRDGGNLRGGLGAITAVPPLGFEGGLLVFPAYDRAVNLRPLDVLIADNRELHGNTAFGGTAGRLAVVAYFHKSNLPAG